ncbi:hypothetical protein D3C71_1240220 [compost metagenome]
MPAQALSRLTGNGHPQTNAPRISITRTFQTEERFKHRFALFRRDPRSVVDDPDDQLFAMVFQRYQRLSGIAQGIVQQVVDAGAQCHRLHLQRRTMAAGLDIGTLVLGVFAQRLDQCLHIHPLRRLAGALLVQIGEGGVEHADHVVQILAHLALQFVVVNLFQPQLQP